MHLDVRISGSAPDMFADSRTYLLNLRVLMKVSSTVAVFVAGFVAVDPNWLKDT